LIRVFGHASSSIDLRVDPKAWIDYDNPAKKI
jgi:hypothetical protein